MPDKNVVNKSLNKNKNDVSNQKDGVVIKPKNYFNNGAGTQANDGVQGSIHSIDAGMLNGDDKKNHKTISANADNTVLNKFSSGLNTALDFYQLFDALFDELKSVVPCNSIEYEYEKTETFVTCGVSSQFCCVYTLKYEEKSLGDIRITRDTEFLETEFESIEVMLSGLVQPLRSVLRYQHFMRFGQRDELTGLRNDEFYRDFVELEIRRAHHYKKPFSLLVLNLDDFENVNKRYGRSAGDAALLQVAGRIVDKARRSDIIYRKLGDEFLVFLPNTDKAEAAVIAKRIKDNVLSKACVFDNEDIEFTLCAGVVTVSRSDTVGTLIDRVEKALTNAKTMGKNRICVESFQDLVQLGGDSCAP